MSIVRYKKKRGRIIRRKRGGRLARTRPKAMTRTGYLKTAQKYAYQYTLPVLSTETGLALKFQLSDIPQNVTFSKLFDSYRINKVVVKAFPLTNSTININPAYKIISAIDLDDSITPTVASLLERSNSKIQIVTSAGNTAQMKTWTVRPRYLTQLFESAVTSGYGQGSRSQWLDCADPTIPHFGLKLVFETDPTLNNTIVWQFYVSYYVEFKSLR